MKAYLLLVIILCNVLSGKAQNNYIIFHPAEKAGITRIYIDRAGNVYPPKDYIDSTKFGWVDRRNHDYADIKAYFLKYDPDAFRQVLSDNRVTTFDQLQNVLINNCAAELNNKLAQSHKLIMLIHGFNEYAANAYDSLETTINNYLGDQQVTYLEVYWDGLKANSEMSKDVFKIWFRANRTAPYPAIALRKLLAKIDDADVYIVTHSLGACIGARLLFNTREDRNFSLKEEWQKLATPAQSSITLVMLAPAIAGRRVFKYLNNTVPAGSTAHYKRIVIGYNKYDVATTKKMRFPLSRMFYSTSLGCDPGAIKYLARTLHRIDPSRKYYIIDFSLTANAEKARIHHIDKYINDTAHFNQLLKNVFNAE